MLSGGALLLNDVIEVLLRRSAFRDLSVAFLADKAKSVRSFVHDGGDKT